MPFLFMLVALYCLGVAIRRFMGKAAYYVNKDPDVTKTQKEKWCRFNGYSLLFWAGFALLFATEMLLDAWPFYIAMGICAAGGVYMAMRGSVELRREPVKGMGTGRQKKKKKK